MRIDLHAHTSASDGTDSPSGLIAAARAAGLDVVAITDHDTTAGWDDALRAVTAGPPGLAVIPGAELSCVHAGESGRRVNLHLLAYLFDAEHGALRAAQTELRESRLNRGAEIVERLVADGHRVSWQQVQELSADGPIGRPHIARALVDAGVVASVDEAFAGPLAHGSKYYVRQRNLDVITAIALVRDAGGVPVFAHPFARQRGPIVDDDAVVAMAHAGLAGIEAGHPDHDDSARVHATELAERLGLVRTGSSDYHGANRSTNDLGACITEPEAYAQLIAQATARHPVSA